MVPGNGNWVLTGLWFFGSGTGGVVKLFKKLRIMFAGNKGWRMEVGWRLKVDIAGSWSYGDSVVTSTI
jgi:hypothetical protein